MAPRSEAQRAWFADREARRQALPKIPCACGCGTLIPPVTVLGKPAQYANHHHPARKGREPWNKGTADKAARAANRAAKREALPKIPCACGCGTLIPSITSGGQPARYAYMHQPHNPVARFKPGAAPWNKGKPYPAASERQRGQPKSAEHRANLKAAAQDRLERTGGKWHTRGYQMAPEKRAKLNALTRERLSQLTGDKNPQWRGGVSFLPYGPEFNRRFKKLIRDRDGNRCRRCGRHRAELDRPLHVHHLDRDKSNNDPANLLSLCINCHTWLHHHFDEPFDPLPIAG